MSDYSKEILSVKPVFDFEILFGLLQESRVGGQVMEDLARVWESWLPELGAMTLDTGKIKYLALWLNETVEKQVDEAFARSASGGFRLNALAQTLVMCALYQLLPEVESAGCAPAPKPTEAVAAALLAEGVPYQSPGGPTLCRRFSVLTHYPFRGACDICYLSDNCPKAGGRAESFHSVEIPGPNPSPDMPPPFGRAR